MDILAQQAVKSLDDKYERDRSDHVFCKSLGAKGDGLSTGDADVLRKAADLATTGRKNMVLGAGTYRSYPIARPPLPNGGGDDYGRILLGPGTGFDAAGGTIEIHGNARSVDPRGTFTAKTAVTAAMLAGADTFPVASTEGYEVDRWVMWRLGDMIYDAPETYNWGFGIIKSIGANSVTIDRPVPLAFTADQLAAAVHNKHLYAVDPIVGIDYGDMQFTAVGNDGAVGFCVKYAIGPRAGVVSGDGINVGVHIAQYVQGFHVDAIISNNSKKVVGQEANTGAASRYAEASGYVGLLLSNASEGYASYAEAASSLTYGRVHDINPIKYVGGDRRAVIVANGRTKIHILDAVFEGFGDHLAGSNLDGSAISYDNVTVRTSTPMHGIPMPGRECRRLTIVNGSGEEEIYRAEDGFWWGRKIVLADAATVEISCPPGAMADLRIYAGGCVQDDFEYINLRREPNYAGGVPLKENVEQNKDKVILISGGVAVGYAGAVGGSNWSDRDKRPIFAVKTNADRSLTGSGKFLFIRTRMIPNANATPPTLNDQDFLGFHG